MEIVKHTDPWLHYTIENFFTFDESKLLYEYCLKSLPIDEYNNKSLFFEHGEYQNNVGVTTIMPPWCYEKVTSQFSQISDYLDLHLDNFSWSMGFSITGDLPEKPLRPHNDDYDVLSKLPDNKPGKVKCLVYIGNGMDDYADWGTKLYSENDNFSSFKKEVEFVPGRAFLFLPTHDTYHGTDFTKGIKGYRFILGAEYNEN